MAAPGTTVTVSSAVSATSIPVPTGTAFMVGLSQRGPVGVALALRSMADVAALIGSRVAASPVWDCCDVKFREGVSLIQFSRVAGPAATPATLVLRDSATTPLPTLNVSSYGPGLAANSINVQVTAGTVAGSFLVTVLAAGLAVEKTPANCLTPADAVNWSQTSSYIRLTDAGSSTAAPGNNPAVVASTPLTGGLDDNVNAGDSQFAAALAAFPPNLGPGQVLAPGRTTVGTQVALANHAASISNGNVNRLALGDAAPGNAAAVLATHQAVQAAASDPSYFTTVGPSLLYPGVPTGSAAPAYPRVIPASAVAAALMARSDIINDANTAAAGANGQALSASDVTIAYSDADRDLLNAAGVCVFRNMGVFGGGRGGQVELYGYVTASLDPAWTDLANVRLRMQIIFESQVIMSNYNFGQLDAQNRTLTALGGHLGDNLSRHWARGSLYGITPSLAYLVNVGPTVNTPASIAGRQFNAALELRMSPSGQFSNITIVKVPTTSPLPV